MPLCRETFRSASTGRPRSVGTAPTPAGDAAAAAGGRRPERLPEIQGQRQVAGDGPVQDDLPQGQAGLCRRLGRAGGPLPDDSRRRAQRDNLDFFADRGGQRPLDLPQGFPAGCADRADSVRPVCRGRAGRRPAFPPTPWLFHADLEPPARSGRRPVAVLQAPWPCRTRAGSPSTASAGPPGGHRLQIGRQVGRRQLDLRRRLISSVPSTSSAPANRRSGKGSSWILRPAPASVRDAAGR